MKPLLADKLVVSLMGSMGVEREEDATALFSSCLLLLLLFDSGTKEKKPDKSRSEKEKEKLP